MKNKIILILMLLLLIPSVSADIYIGNNTIIPGYFMGFMNFSYIQAFPAVPCTSSPAQYSRWNGTGFACFNDQSGSGGITSLTQGNGIILTPNPITSTGTVEVDTSFDFKNSTVANNTANWNNTYNATYLRNDQTTFPNSSLTSENFAAWNTTSPCTNCPNSTITTENLLAWNNTYNGTYDGFLTLINALQVNDTNDRAYVNSTFLKIVDLNTTIDRKLSNFTNDSNWVSNSTADKNYNNLTNLPILLTNTTMDKNLSNFTNVPGFITSNYNSTYDNTTKTVNGNLQNWNDTFNSTYDLVAKSIISNQYNASTMTILGGTLIYGDVNNTFIHDLNSSVIQEGTGTDANNITFNWSYQIPQLDNILFVGRYDGGSTHYVVVEIENKNTSLWDTLGSFPSSAVNQSYAFSIPDTEHYSNGYTRARLRHVGSGNTVHTLYIDQFVIRNTGASGTSSLGLLMSHISNTSNPHQTTMSQIGTDFPNSTISNNSVNWNNTYNSTYDLKEPAIVGSTNNVFWNGLKNWISLSYLNISNFNSTVQSIVETYGYITNSTAQISENQVTNLNTDLNNKLTTTSLNTTIDRKLSNFTNDQNWVSNTTLDRKLSNFTNDSNWVSNTTMDKNYNNLTNLPSFITNTTMDRKLSNFTNDVVFVTNTSVDRKLSNFTNDNSWISNSTMDRNLNNFTNFLNWISNLTMDRNLNNFTNSPNFVSNTSVDKNLNNFTNSPGFVSNTTMDKAYNNMTGIPTNFANLTVDTNDRRYSQVVAGINNGTLVIPTGIFFDIEIPFNATIVGAKIVSDQSGSTSVNVYKCTYSAFPCTTSIVGGTPLSLVTAQKNQSTLFGWTTSINKGDYLRFDTTSATTVTRIVATITIQRT